MAIPKKSDWDTLKRDAGISKAPWWKPADAAVGPALAKLEAAKAAWKANKKLDDARNYIGALSKVHEAFTKFLKKKDLSSVAASNLRTQIGGWMDEVADKHEKMKGKLDNLKTDDAKELDGIMDQIVI
jgi:hypothetical protein